MSWRIEVRESLGALKLELDLQGDDGDHGPLALVGPNGSGKTTLLRILAGAHRPAHARIEIDGEVLVCTKTGVELPIERRRVAYVPQGYALFEHLTALDNVAFGLSTGPRRGRLPPTERRARARALLERLDCGHLAARMPARLSGGEQQRVALARALVLDPRLLLLDEPLAALDVRARRSVRAFLAEHLRALGRPSIVVTHDLRDVATWGARVCVLEAGRVVQQGTVDDLRAAPANDFVAELVGA